VQRRGAYQQGHLFLSHARAHAGVFPAFGVAAENLRKQVPHVPVSERERVRLLQRLRAERNQHGAHEKAFGEQAG
jgi:hypothetical protein